MHADHPQPFALPPGSGRELKNVGITHRLTRAETGGAYYLFEFDLDPESGTRLHVHRHEDEVVYVLEGAIEIRLDSRRLQAGAGGVVHLPKTIPHALYNPLKTPSRYLALAIPGGLEDFFEALSAARDSGPLDATTNQRISREHGIEWLE
jgi:mannose-6-phosphate isomerase-like protein (cupin superfamily)